MDMKRLEISKLMDEYTDTEFFPTGGSTADLEAVKGRVLAQAAPAKRRRRPLKMALLAAAIAGGSWLLVRAGAAEATITAVRIVVLFVGVVGIVAAVETHKNRNA